MTGIPPMKSGTLRESGVVTLHAKAHTHERFPGGNELLGGVMRQGEDARP